MSVQIVIVHPDSAQAAFLARTFSACGCTVAGVGSTGAEAVELCSSLRPQAVLTAPLMPYLNCDDLAEILARKCDFPLVKLVLSERRYNVLAERFLENGGDFFFVQPVDFPYCVRRIAHLCARGTAPAAATPVAYSANRFLKELRMLPSYKGYHYILAAMELMLAAPAGREYNAGELYEAIALRHGSTPTGVERCIRKAVEYTFERGDVSLIDRAFGQAADPASGKLSNKRFLAILADLIREDLHL